MAKNTQVQFRCTEIQKVRLKHKAHLKGVSVSSLLLQLALGKNSCDNQESNRKVPSYV